MTALLAFHGDPAIKETYLARVRAHREADQLAQGHGYWHSGRGCAVGCTIHGDDHGAYERELGIPAILAFIEDNVFEQLPGDLARAWPENFLAAVPVGADLSLVAPRLLRRGVVLQHGTLSWLRVTQHVRHKVARVIDETTGLLDAWIKGAPFDGATTRALAAAQSALVSIVGAREAGGNKDQLAIASGIAQTMQWLAEAVNPHTGEAPHARARRVATSQIILDDYIWTSEALLEELAAAPVAKPVVAGFGV